MARRERDIRIVGKERAEWDVGKFVAALVGIAEARAAEARAAHPTAEHDDQAEHEHERDEAGA